jgi:hypothetical protein
MSALWDKISGLPLEIEDYGLDRLSRDVTSGFTRVSTVIRLFGDGQEGLGEDVGYETEDQEVQLAAGPVQPLAGNYTLQSFSEHLGTLDLWPQPATHEPSINYRRWAYESAALDLALRQNGLSLHEALGRDVSPLTFVVSIRIGEPASAAPIHELLEREPSLRFKLDPTPSWDDAVVAELAATGAVDCCDLKGLYEDSPVDNPADPELYRRVAEGFPDAYIEDPKLTPETTAVLEPHSGRVTWDASVHGISDLKEAHWAPKATNIKPSRFGPISNLFETYEYCEANGINMYAGGQFELGVGRGQIQYLAAIFHPHSGNDCSPGEFHMPSEAPVLPGTPLAVAAHRTGFRWA